MSKLKPKLTIELVPSSSWGQNLRNLLKPKMWEVLRKKTYQRSNFRCAICGASGKLEAHEVWKFDDKNHIQKLVDLIALCKKCHAVKHIGFAGIKGSFGKVSYEEIVAHFTRVNACDRKTFQDSLKKAFEKFEKRSQFEWNLDLSFLKKVV